MPFRRRRKSKRYSRKRSFKKRYAQSAPVPASKLVKLKYVGTRQLNADVSTVSSYVFSANGLYDPDITGLGHQPMGFDQWMTFYDHYTVIGSKITVKALNTGAAATDSQVIGITLHDNPVGGASTEINMEQATSSWKVLPPMGTANATILRKGFSAKRFFGRPKSAIVNSSDFRGTNAANPTEGSYFIVWAGGLIPTDNPSQTNLLVTIEYTAVFNERKELAQS